MRSFFIVVPLFSQVALQRDEHQLHTRAILRDFANPLAFYVLERVGRVHAEAEHDGVCVIVGEGS